MKSQNLPSSSSHKREPLPGGGYVDLALADALPPFFVSLKQCKGEFAGRGLQLQNWQLNQVIIPLLCHKRQDGLRKHRKAFLALPRKSGKTTLAAAITLYCLLVDDEPGGEIVCAAADTNQASIAMAIAKEMVIQSPVYSKWCRVFRREIVNQRNGSVLKVISSEANTKHGYSLSAAVVDEVHAHKDSELIDVLSTSVGSRRQSLLTFITTAGYDRTSPCYSMWKYAESVRDGNIVDPTFLPVIYSLPSDEDWRLPENWKKANPGMGITIKEDYLEAACNEAKANPLKENVFRQLHLNQWTEGSSVFIPMDKFKECIGPRPSEDELIASPCYMGLDLSSVSDITAITLAFALPNGKVWLEPFGFVPRETIRMREKKSLARYDAYARDGFLDVTDGEVIDFSKVKAKIYELAEKYSIREVAVDRWNAAQLSQELQEAGLDVVGFGQGFYSMSPATKLWEASVLSKRIQHGDHPVFNWCFSNCVVEKDASGNIKLSKAKSSERIDMVVAAVQALARLDFHEAANDSEYSGITIL